MRRWQHLLFSTALTVTVLAVGTGSYLAIVRQERLEALEQAEREAEAYLEQLREARDQLREAEERLEALEDMLLNLHQMQQIAERSAAPSRPLSTPSGFTAARFERVFAGTGLAGLGQAFYGAEKAYGVNGVVLAAICYHESAGGTSRLARERNNLAGLGAYSAGMGMTFDTRADCIDYLARLLAGRPGSLAEVGAWYAEDPGWSAKVAACVKKIAGRGDKNGR